MENGIHPWYSSTHVIHPPMEFTHGIVSGIHPWYSSTHGIYPWYCKWYLPMVLAYGIYTWYCNSKKAINNKPHFVKGQIVHHNVASTVILCFNKKNLCGFIYCVFSLFSGILILQILSDPFQLFRSWGPPPKIQINSALHGECVHGDGQSMSRGTKGNRKWES